MSFLFELFALGTVGFWIILVIASTVITSLVENDRPVSPTIVMLVTLVLLQFFGGVPVYYWVIHNPLSLLAAFIAYLFIGAWYHWQNGSFGVRS